MSTELDKGKRTWWSGPFPQIAQEVNHVSQEHLSTAGKRSRVTREKSAEIDRRIGELCKTASAHEITPIINQEFKLPSPWTEHTVWNHARKAGHRWPGKRAHRLTPKDYEQLDQRLRELHRAGTRGTEMVEIVSAETGQPWTLAGIHHRVTKKLRLEWIDTPKDGRPWVGTEKFPEDQWKACYDDPVYEARNQIRDRLVCRECLSKALLDPTLHVALYRDGAMDGKDSHLRRIHGLGMKDYRLLHPGAPINTWDRIAKEWGRDVYEVMARKVDEYATPEELAVAQNDPLYDQDLGFVICRIPRCGFKSVARLDKHFRQAHGMNAEKVEEHRRKYNWPPIATRDQLTKQAGRNRERIAELKQKAWRPSDWDDPKKLEDRTVATEILLADPKKRNKAVAKRLDGLKIRCPYAKTWVEAASDRDNRAFIVYMNRVAKWIKPPGS